MLKILAAALLAAFPLSVASLNAEDPSIVNIPEIPPSAIEQLQHAIGEWDVETDFISDSGEVYTAVGTYKFRWIVKDKVVSGIAKTPELKQKSAILFFHRPDKKEIEMASVGADGQLWRMIGPEDSEIRTTPNVEMPDGSKLMLRFTRHSVTPDSFGSMMEMSTDGGESWRIGNRQRFTRKTKD